MSIKTVLVVLTSCAMLIAQQAMPSYALSKAAKKLENPELRDFYRGNLHYKPFVHDHAIYGFSVYRTNKLILHKKAPGDFINALYIELPYYGKRARLVHTFNGGIDDFVPRNGCRVSTPFVDLNGDGVPDIIAASLDSRLTSAYEIYSLTTPAKTISKTAENFFHLSFIDLDKDGKYEAVGYDGTFHYWCECGLNSPSPVVVLEFGKSGLQLSTRFMHAAAPSEEYQKRMLARWTDSCKKASAKANSKFWLVSDVWRDMLDLIYSGNSKVAFALLDRFWKPGTFAANLNENSHASKEDFVRYFLERLNESRYIDGLRRLNPDDAHIADSRYVQQIITRHKTIFVNRDCPEVLGDSKQTQPCSR